MDSRTGTDLHTRRAHQQLELRHRELKKDLEHGAARWLIPRFVSTSALGLAVAMVLPAVMGQGWEVFDPSSPAFLIRCLGPIAVSAVSTPILYVSALRRSRRSLDELVREREAEVTELTGPGWVRRVVRQGVRLAGAIGVPVGAILAFGFPVEELPAGSRALAWGGFVLATALWTIPAAFLIRWVALRGHSAADPR